MYKIDDYVVYKHDVCRIIDIKDKKGISYYVLIPINDNSLKISIPIDNSFGLRSLITLDRLNCIIKEIPKIEIISNQDKSIENVYKELLNSGKLEDLIKIIKTAYYRNQIRTLNKKKIGDKDNTYFELAEKYLYTEFSIVLNKNFEETKNYVINEVLKLKE